MSRYQVPFVEFGVFGGEIEEILSEPVMHKAPQTLQ